MYLILGLLAIVGFLGWTQTRFDVDTSAGREDAIMLPDPADAAEAALRRVKLESLSGMSIAVFEDTPYHDGTSTLTCEEPACSSSMVRRGRHADLS